MRLNLTWQDAKVSTQAMELEIVERIPEDQVVHIEQKEKGTLFSCDAEHHNWHGATTVTLQEGIEPEQVVRAVEASFADSLFQISVDRSVLGYYRVQLIAPNLEESYLFSEDEPNKIRIDSGSACFTLPEGVYPGGEF